MKQLPNIREKLRGLTIRRASAEALLRTSRRIARVIRRAADRPGSTYVSGDALKRALGDQPVAVIATRVRERVTHCVTPGLSELAGTVEAVKRLFPGALHEAAREADEILAHRIKLFGRSFDLGPQIDWHRDPVSGARWPGDHFTRVQLGPGGGADVRVAWELNRLQHLVTLGRSYALTGDERYAAEFAAQLASWYEHNPPRFGVNWTVAMEAALRAVNLLAAFQLFRRSPLVTDAVVETVFKTALAHGRFVRANLEFSYRVTSNHYLSDLIGLFVIGATLPELAEAREWVNFSAQRLLEEIEGQVLDDGVDYEGSTAYHRFALEIFALFFSLAGSAGIDAQPRHWRRLESMFDFVRHYLKPDGTAPTIGDSDDGRLIKFRERPAEDHSYLLSIAAVLFKSSDFKQTGVIDEDAVWWYGAAGAGLFEDLPANLNPPGSQAFNDAQIFIQRQGDLYAIIDCGDHGARGHGSHAHSDALSLELFGCGRTLLRDPGAFAYSASERWRNRFRSTPYHNTVRIDGCEISEIRPGRLFALGRNVKPRVISWFSSTERDALEAEHDAYARFREPVVHNRVVTFEKREGYWIITDSFTGQGTHRFEWFFNFDAGLAVRLDGLRAIARGDKAALAIVPVSGRPLEAKLTTRWVSPSYGTRVRASGIIYRFEAQVPFENVLVLMPYEVGNESKLEGVLGTWADSHRAQL